MLSQSGYNQAFHTLWFQIQHYPFYTGFFCSHSKVSDANIGNIGNIANFV